MVMRNYPGIAAKFQFNNTDDIRASMTITMSIKQWRSIAEALSTEKYEEWPLRSAIVDLIQQAHGVLHAEEQPK